LLRSSVILTFTAEESDAGQRKKARAMDINKKQTNTNRIEVRGAEKPYPL
jgi:hypothetical protein